MHQLLEPQLAEGSGHSKNDTRDSYLAAQQHQSLFEYSFPPTLPSKDYIIHLARIVDFHFSANCWFFNLAELLDQISQTPAQRLQAMSGILLTKLLIVIALGKLFLERGATTLGPPGIREFLQAAHCLPSNIQLNTDPITSVEIFCLLSIYAQAADMHDTAYLYVCIYFVTFHYTQINIIQAGQASRMARACRLDRKLDSYDTHRHPRHPGWEYEHKIWCTVCVIDHRHSATLGAYPDCSIHEQNNRLISPENNLASVSGVMLRLNLSIANMLTKATKGSG